MTPILLTSSADTRISLAFSSASCLMNRTICSIWRWTCFLGFWVEEEGIGGGNGARADVRAR
jgi:hypothetical protein